MLNITRRDIDEAYASMRDAHSYIQRYKGQGETAVGQLTQTLGVSAGALGVGILSGRFGALHIAGSKIPLDLAGGIIGHGLAFFGLAGKYGEHLHNFSDGVMAGWITKWGVGLGAKMAVDAGKAPPPVTAGVHHQQLGASPAGNAGNAGPRKAPLTEAELTGMAHGIR